MFDEKKFAEAESIAHQFFWISDDPIIKNRVEKYVNRYMKEHSLSVATYVAIICKEIVKEEKSLRAMMELADIRLLFI